jgi:hypothetical protein
MLACYEIFIRMELIGDDEITLLEAWLASVRDLDCGSKRAAETVKKGN